MFQRSLAVLMVLGSTVALGDIAAPAEVGVEKAVQVLQQIVARQITSEAQAVKSLGAEGAILFRSLYSLRNQGLSGGLGSVNYTELASKLKGAGVSGNDFITHVKELSSLGRMVSMSDLVTVKSLAVPKPRQTDNLAIIERLAPKQLENYRFPGDALARNRQSVVARLLRAAEAGAELCVDRAICLSNNIGVVVEFERLGLIDRGLSVNFAEEAFLGFPKEETRYVGRRLHPISENFRMALVGAKSADSIEPAGVRSCILNGTPSMN